MKQKILNRFILLIGAVSVTALLVAPSAGATPFEVETLPAADIGSVGATLNGAYYAQANEGGIWGFQYGTTKAFGQETSFSSVQQVCCGFPTRTRVSARVTNLQPETTYHFRFGVVSAKGEVTYGETLSFTTRAVPRFEASKYAAYMTTTPTSAALNVEGLKCASGSATGTLLAASTSLSMTPTFGQCSTNQEAGNFTTVALNGCRYVYHAGDSGVWMTTMDIVCSPGKSIEYQYGTCAFSIPAQSGLSVIRATNKTSATPDVIEMELSVSGVQYTKTKDGFGCAFNGTGTRNDGSFSGTQILSGESYSSGAPIDVRIG